MRVQRVITLALINILALTTSASAACLTGDQEGQVVEGRLKTYVKPPSGSKKTGPRRRFILTPPAPACMDSGGSVTNSSTIEVYALDDAIRAKLLQFAGHRVVVHGTPRPQSRPHHEAPITMVVSDIQRR